MNGNYWDNVARHLQSKGYFTRFHRVGNVDVLDVCKHDEDIMCHEVARDLSDFELKAQQMLNEESSNALLFVRLTEKSIP